MKDIEIYTGANRGDCVRIQKILAERGYRASLSDCEKLWDRFSDSMCAGWMILNENDEDVFQNISSYIEN